MSQVDVQRTTALSIRPAPFVTSSLGCAAVTLVSYGRLEKSLS
jgi:hypothetical protein